jgi:hypothetical protein
MENTHTLNYTLHINNHTHKHTHTRPHSYTLHINSHTNTHKHTHTSTTKHQDTYSKKHIDSKKYTYAQTHTLHTHMYISIECLSKIRVADFWGFHFLFDNSMFESVNFV